MIRTNIPMIDVFNTLVESQKLPIFSIAGEPYNELLARIALQAEVDVIILGGMGLKHDDYLKFKNTLDEQGALSRTVMFIHTASDPIVECLMVPDMALAVAEQYALEGKRVLALLTDMTNFADALKEIAITMEQIPATRGYPGDLYSQLASRYEKAVDFDSAGSITILAVTTMPGDDVTHPVPDNTGYITEGQFYLRNGRIEPFGSLSRLKQQVNGKTRPDHRAIMDSMIRLYSDFRSTLEKQSMGFQMSAWDKKLLKYGKLFEKNMGSWLFQETRRIWNETKEQVTFAEMETMARNAKPCAFLINPNDNSFVTPGDMVEKVFAPECRIDFHHELFGGIYKVEEIASSLARARAMFRTCTVDFRDLSITIDPPDRATAYLTGTLDARLNDGKTVNEVRDLECKLKKIDNHWLITDIAVRDVLEK